MLRKLIGPLLSGLLIALFNPCITYTKSGDAETSPRILDFMTPGMEELAQRARNASGGEEGAPGFLYDIPLEEIQRLEPLGQEILANMSEDELNEFMGFTERLMEELDRSGVSLLPPEVMKKLEEGTLAEEPVIPKTEKPEEKPAEDQKIEEKPQSSKAKTNEAILMELVKNLGMVLQRATEDETVREQFYKFGGNIDALVRILHVATDPKYSKFLGDEDVSKYIKSAERLSNALAKELPHFIVAAPGLNGEKKFAAVEPDKKTKERSKKALQTMLDSLQTVFEKDKILEWEQLLIKKFGPEAQKLLKQEEANIARAKKEAKQAAVARQQPAVTAGGGASRRGTSSFWDGPSRGSRDSYYDGSGYGDSYGRNFKSYVPPYHDRDASKTHRRPTHIGSEAASRTSETKPGPTFFGESKEDRAANKRARELSLMMDDLDEQLQALDKKKILQQLQQLGVELAKPAPAQGAPLSPAFGTLYSDTSVLNQTLRNLAKKIDRLKKLMKKEDEKQSEKGKEKLHQMLTPYKDFFEKAEAEVKKMSFQDPDVGYVYFGGPHPQPAIRATPAPAPAVAPGAGPMVAPAPAVAAGGWAPGAPAPIAQAVVSSNVRNMFPNPSNLIGSLGENLNMLLSISTN